MKVKKCVIPVAGLGTRFLPITKSIPKTMLTVVDKPILHYIIEEAYEAGFDDFLIVTNKDKYLLQDYFSSNKHLENRVNGSHKINSLNDLNDLMDKVKISYAIEEKPLGSAHGVSLAKEFVSNDPFAIMFGDNLFLGDKSAMIEMVEAFDKYDSNIIGVQEVDKNDVHLYGVIKYDDNIENKIDYMVEKPDIDTAPSNMAAVGRYIVKPEIFDYISNLKPGLHNEYQLTDALIELIKKEPCYACNITSKLFDTGSKVGFIKANIAYSLKRDDLKDEIKEYIKSIS